MCHVSLARSGDLPAVHGGREEAGSKLSTGTLKTQLVAKQDIMYEPSAALSSGSSLTHYQSHSFRKGASTAA